MPGRRKSSLSRSTSQTRRKRDERAVETEEERDSRLAAARAHQAESRSQESEEQREARLAADRARQAGSRAEESEEQREARLAADRARQAASRAEESGELREARLAAARTRQAASRVEESEEQREARLAADRARQAGSRAEESEEQREARLAADRARQAASRAEESGELREARLAAARTRQAASRVEESEEQREARLAADRARQAASRVEESEEQRETRLAADRARHAGSRAEESEEQREARLAADRDHQAASRAEESGELREARLAAARTRQAASRVEESEEQRETRLAADRARQAGSRAEESEEQREARLAAVRTRQAASRVEESEEQREARLAADRAGHEAARSAETQAERDTRRRSERIRQAQRRSTVTEEERQNILQARRNDYTRRQEEAQLLREERSQAAIYRRQRLRDNEEGQGHERRLGEYLPWDTEEGSGFRYDPLINYRTATDIGEMNVRCPDCGALKWKDETAASLCCSAGKVKLQPLQDLPDLLRSLIVDQDHENSRHFLEKARAYNSAFMMTSFGAKEPTEDPAGRGRRRFMPTFKVRGQVYHRIGSLLPPEGAQEQFLQLYFVADERTQATMRMAHVPNLHEDLVRDLQRMLHAVNPLVRELKTCLDTHMEDDTHDIVIRADRVPRGEHPGRHNAPAVDEVGVILIGEQCGSRDIVLKKRDRGLQRIYETHRSYDALQYPLMFPTGEDGYHIALRHASATRDAAPRKMTPKEYYAYRLMVRSNDDNRLLRYRQLTNQYIVDMYAKVETERLTYLRHHQKDLRVDEYVHLQDAIRRDIQARDVGEPVILPSSFVGGPRYMHEKTQDAFMYVRKYARPDLFITFTTNPKWAEIRTNLFQGQQAKDRHDLVSRVFKLKVKKLMELVVTEKIFGTVRCYIYSVEWQKRGLPHIHLLLWLEEKIRPNQIDDVISAELPDPQTDPELFYIVRSNMLHGPCGPLNPSCVCMDHGRCQKRYPRRFVPETVTGEDGYPTYRRRRPAEGGFTTRVTIDKAEVEVDNRWIVPYSPVLCRALQAHINVEYCSSVKSIKYICKYVTKGSDRVSFEVRNQNDEIEIFQTGRYISTSEAMWRILGFDIHERSPPVMHLHVHLEGAQRVTFREGVDLRDSVRNPKPTTQQAFFYLCNADTFARTLLYEEVPAYFTFDKRTGRFNRRRRGKQVEGYNDVFREHVLGRMYTVHIRNTECFCLRMLLHTVRGPTSYEALRTVNGVQFESFERACAELGLLYDDGHLDDTLDEAVLSRSPYKLRQVFTVILAFCSPPHDKAKNLWEKYKDHLSEDFLRQVVPVGGEPTPELRRHAEGRCLKDMSEQLGQTVKAYGLPAPPDVLQPNMALIRETSYDRAALEATVALQEPRLTDEQRRVFNEVLDSVERRAPKVFFLDAPGGTGKTFLINLLLSKVRLTGSIALAVASSGIAATLLPGGKTAHSLFHIPIDLDRTEKPVCGIKKQSNDAELLKQALLLIWDECTMAHKKAVEAVDRTLRDIRSCDILFGGMTVLFSGDFRQTLPVVPRGTRADEVDACLKRSHLWRHVTRLRLTRNMRVAAGGGDGSAVARFSDKLLAIGEGREADDGSGNIQLTEDLCTLHDLEGLINTVYPGISDMQSKSRSWLCERAILTPKNEEASVLNTIIQERFQAEQVVYRAYNRTVDEEDSVNYPTEFLASVTAPGLPAQELTLKVGSPVMLLRNLKPPTLCNGTRLQVTALHANVVEATIMTGVGAGEDVFIPRIPIIPSNYPFQFKRIQLPLSLCFAMTINKSQGQTLKVAGLDLRSGCFSHGQLYVACSRVSSTEALFATANGPSTTNVVYKEVIHD